MSVVISVTNQKGGVGKTVTVSTLASALTSRGFRVLAVDLDPQRNLDMVAGRGMAIPVEDTATKSVLDVLKGDCSMADAIVQSNLGDLVRASSRLSQWTGRHLITRDEYASMPQGEILALEDGKLAFTEKDLTKACVKLTRSLVRACRDCSFISIIYGKDVTEEAAAKVEAAIRSKAPNNVEVALIRGDQPVYYYIISVE